MAKTTQQGKTNGEAYATYRHYVEKITKDIALREEIESVRNLFPVDSTLLVYLVGAWSARYCRRMEAIHRWKFDDLDPLLADSEAKEILKARHRTHNALYEVPTEFTAEQIDALRTVESSCFSHVDVSSMTDIPSYGPSMISLWADAKKAGLSNDEAQARIEDWQYYTPPAWAHDDEQERKKLPKIDKAVQARLNQPVTWQRIADLFSPWNAQVGDEKWEVRVNDFPDEHMYSLLINGAPLGDFQEWPEAWDRGSGRREPAAPAKVLMAPVSVDAERLVARYQRGDCEAVWRDLVALGADVRKPAYAVAAHSIATETTRRVRHNLQMIVERLRLIDYQFHGAWDSPELREDPKLIAACEQEGLFLPLSFQKFVMELGAISLLGLHPRIAPEGVETDALMVGGPSVLEAAFEQWKETDPEDRDSLLYDVAPTAESKIEILEGDLPNMLLGIQLPTESADAVLEGEPEGRRFVEYLRWSFQWGGFPGWERQTNRPEKELASLKDGLLPI